MKKFKFVLSTILFLVLLCVFSGCADLETGLRNAAYEGDLEHVIDHVEKGADLNGKDYGGAPIHYAINAAPAADSPLASYSLHKEIIEYLVACGADANVAD